MKFIITCVLWGICVAGSFGDFCSEQPPMKMSIQECCDIPMPSESTVNKCITDLEDQTKKLVELGLTGGSCLAECTLNATKVYTGNGVIDEEALKVLLLESAVGPEWKELIPNVISTCMKESVEHAQEMKKIVEAKPAFPGEKQCHPISGYVMICILENTFLQCPASKYTKNDDCEVLKTFIKKCPATM